MYTSIYPIFILSVDAKWIEISSELKLFASHQDFIKKTAELHNANWTGIKFNQPFNNTFQ